MFNKACLCLFSLTLPTVTAIFWQSCGPAVIRTVSVEQMKPICDDTMAVCRLTRGTVATLAIRISPVNNTSPSTMYRGSIVLTRRSDGKTFNVVSPDAAANCENIFPTSKASCPLTRKRPITYSRGITAPSWAKKGVGVLRARLDTDGSNLPVACVDINMAIV